MCLTAPLAGDSGWSKQYLTRTEVVPSGTSNGRNTKLPWRSESNSPLTDSSTSIGSPGHSEGGAPLAHAGSASVTVRVARIAQSPRIAASVRALSGRACRLPGGLAPAGVPAILNRIVQYSHVDGAFAALADPTRRGILERLGRGRATITQLAEPFGISLTGVKKHVRVLENAELVTTEKVGRARECSLGPRTLDDVQEWLDTYRRMQDERLDRFGELLKRTKGAP